MATYYWVGGSGTWDASTTTNWSSTSGGSGGAGVPTSADDAIFDVSSGTSSDTVTVATGAEVNSFFYTADGEIDFSGAGQELRVYGSFEILASIPLRVFGVDTIFLRVTGSSSAINTLMPLKNLTISNWTSPLTQTTFTFASDVTCDAFINSLTSLSMDFYKLTCDSCSFTGSSTSFARSVSNGLIEIYPPSGTTTAFSCVWTGSLATFTMVSVSVIDAVDPVIVSSLSTPSSSTSFNLTVSNSNVYFASLSGGVNSLSLESGATFNSNIDFDLYGELSIDSGCTLSGSNPLYGVQIKKKTGSPNVSRTILASSSSTWEEIGLRNYVLASTDGITIAGDIGTPSAPVKYFWPGYANINSVDVHAEAVVLGTGNVFSGTTITVYANGSVTALGGDTISGAFTINALNGSYFSTNDVQLDTVNISGTVESYSDFRVTDLSLVSQLGAGTISFGTAPGTTITVLGTFLLDGLAAPDGIVLQSTPSFGPTGVFYISKASGVVDAQFATIIDSNASGGARFLALESNGCVDGGNNSGWIFEESLGNFFVFL